MTTNTAIRLIDGPLDGQFHELQFGFPVPDRFSLLSKDRTQRHWYITDDDKTTATFDLSEPQ